ncbi:MAG: hypothetical protein Q9165_001241 [Trypethelium subeluteriae]
MCTEQNYCVEDQPQPWARARERVFNEMSTRVLDVVYGPNEYKKSVSRARMERLRTIEYGEDRAWELAAQLEQDLAGEEHSFRRRARQLAERVRQELAGVDVAYMRDEATMLAQQFRSHVQATDEGCIDIWEHMNVCLGKGTTSRKAKSKRLKLFPDERERIESEERDKPEQYQVPNVELIFSWDHNQQGRPRSRKRAGRTSSKQPDELPALSHHLKTEIPQALQAYKARVDWKESQRKRQEGSGKRKREASEQDEENDDGPSIPFSPPAQQSEAGPAAKRRYQTDRGRRGGATGNRGKQKRATGNPSPPLYTEEPSKRRGKGRGLTYFPSAGKSVRRPNMSPPTLSSFAINQEEQAPPPSEGRLQTGASVSQPPINQPNFPNFDPRFTSSPTSIAPSTGPSTARPIYPALPAQPAVSYAQPHSAWPNPGSGRSYAANASVATAGTGASGSGAVQQQGPPPIRRVGTEPNAHRAHRGTPFTSPYQAAESHAWSAPLLPQSYQQQYQQQISASANPSISQIQGDAAAARPMSSMPQDPRVTGLAQSGSSQGLSSPYSYRFPGPGITSELNPTSDPSNAGTAPTDASTEQATAPLYTQPTETFGAEQFESFLDPGINFEYRSELMASPPMHSPGIYSIQPASTTWPPGMSPPQNVASPASMAVPYPGSSHNDGTINPSTLDGPYYASAPTQPPGQIYANYEFMADDNRLLDLIIQNLSPQMPPGPVPQQQNEPCSNPNCEPCRRLRNG